LHLNLSRKPTLATWLPAVVPVLIFGALGVWIIAAVNIRVPVCCEVDGHFHAANWIACGLVTAFRSTWGPLYPWLIALFSFFTGSTYLAGKIISLICGAWIVGLTFRAGKLFAGSVAAGTTAALLVVFNADFLFYSTLVCNDILAVSLLLVSLHLVLVCITGKSSTRVWLLSGLAAAAALLVRDQSLFFVAGILISVFVFSEGSFTERVKPVAIFLAAMIPVLLVSAAFEVFTGDTTWLRALGIEHLLKRGATIGDGMLAGYGRSARLLVWTCGRVLSVGLALTPLLIWKSKKSRKVLLAALVPLTVYFLGVGWFPEPGHDEIRRLFLIFVPVLAVIASAMGMKLVRTALGPGRISTTVFLAALVAIAAAECWITFPSIQGSPMAEAFPPDSHGRRPKVVIGPPHEEKVEVAVAERFKDRVDTGCDPVVTHSMSATTVFANTYFFMPPLQTTNLAEALGMAPMSDGRRGAYVMVRQDKDFDQLIPGEFPGENGSFSLSLIDTFDGFNFYRAEILDER
jgi:Dolichyl-phosphate-mannose-protein mannosyltransferase